MDVSMREVLVEKIPPPRESDEHKDVWFDKNGKMKRQRIRLQSEAIDFFYKNGILNGGINTPCVIGNCGYRAYYTNNKKHRGVFEPAEIFSDGTKRYYVYGELRFEVDPHRNRKLYTRRTVSDTVIKLYSLLFEDGINK